ncbi:MAG: hypothetical protein WAO52_13095, partial [Prolixibacteraceae bacterium]
FLFPFHLSFKFSNSIYHISVPAHEFRVWGGKIRLFNNRSSCRLQERGKLSAFSTIAYLFSFII